MSNLRWVSVFWLVAMSVAAIAATVTNPYNITVTTGTAIDVPGPSATLYNNPWYTCTRNFYVATTGNDANPGTQAQPWLTVQHADTASRTGGDCINVAAGTYQQNVLIQHGGNAPTASGYVVYRCQTMNACHLLASGSGDLFKMQYGGNFVVIDGFDLDGNDALQAGGVVLTCVSTGDDTPGTSSTQAGSGSHHIWVLNNLIHHCGQSGVQLNNREWFYAIHNTLYHNSWNSGFNGSGLSYFAIQCIEAGATNCFTSAIAGQSANAINYTPSGNDTASFNGLSAWAPFHNVVAWNVAYNNRVTPLSTLACNGGHTDGNGFIMDTFRDGFAFNLQYQYQTLVMNNVAYYNGGKGVHTFRGVNITFANNTAYDNNTDTCEEQNGWVVGDLSSTGSGSPPGDGSNNTWINNLSKAVQGPFGWTQSTPHGPNHCALIAWGAGDVNKVYTNNIWNTGESGNAVAPVIHACLGDNDVNFVNCTSNKCSTDPGFVNATPGTVGDVNGNPVGGTWTPGNHNLAITGASPANNYVVSPAPSWLPAQNTDAGACHHSLTTCPNPGTSNF